MDSLEGIPEQSDEIDSALVKPLGRDVGHGSFGRVYLADYLGTEVAVKALAPREGEDPLPPLYIRREVSILRACRHPNIVTYMGLIKRPPPPGGSEYDGWEIVMEFCSKGDLRSYLKRPDVDISWRRRVTMLIDICRALTYLHAKKIIFRDLKCKNFLLDFHTRVKVCDFGFARSTSDSAAGRPSTICGTEGFQSPEVILGMPYDLSADVFSFGMVMLEVVSRQRIDKVCARGPADFFGVVPERVRASGIIPKDTPPRLLDLAFACTKYEPSERPSFQQLLSALGEMLSAMPTRHRSNAVRSPLSPPASDRRPENVKKKENRPAAASSPVGPSAAVTSQDNDKASEAPKSPHSAMPPLDISKQNGAATRAASSNVLSKGKSPRKGVQDLFHGPESPK